MNPETISEPAGAKEPREIGGVPRQQGAGEVRRDHVRRCGRFDVSEVFDVRLDEPRDAVRGDVLARVLDRVRIHVERRTIRCARVSRP